MRQADDAGDVGGAGAAAAAGRQAGGWEERGRGGGGAELLATVGGQASKPESLRTWLVSAAGGDPCHVFPAIAKPYACMPAQ